MDAGLESKIQDFIDRYIDSVEQLEILLLLKDSAPKGWTAREVNDKLLSNAESVKERLQHLCKLKLLECVGDTFIYPGSLSEEGPTIEALAKAYKNRRIKIIEMIFSRPKSRLRDFSDAFKIRKGPKKDG